MPGLNWAKMLTSGAARRTLTGAGVGAVAGGLYGAMSDNTSVLGGALVGAGLGAGAARYGGAGLKMASNAGRGMGFKASASDWGQRFGRGVVGRARLDFRGATQLANHGLNAFKGLGR